MSMTVADADHCIDIGRRMERHAIVAWLRKLPFDSSISGDGHPEDMCPNCVTPWKCNGPALDEDTVKWTVEQLESCAHLPSATEGSES